MKYRIFLLNRKYCIVHYPEKPNGFGVLIIGNGDQYVDEKGSSWLNNENKSALLQRLLDEGYIIFYPDLSFNHMGNHQAADLTKTVYEYMKRHEIINSKIHLIVEGIGALLLPAFLEEKQQSVRSLLFINPLFSLDWLEEEVKDQPFLYRKFLQNIREAYQVHGDDCEKIIKNNRRTVLKLSRPYKIIHILEHGIKDEKWIKNYKKLLGETEQIHLLLPEKRKMIQKYALDLFKQTEHPL